MKTRPFLIFDLDGTISDPAVGIERSINYALQHYGYPTISENEVPQFIGPPLDISFGAITGNSAPERIANLMAKYRERYAAIGYSENTLYEGIPEALNALASAGVPIGLCTSKPVNFAENILRLFGLREHFHFLNGGGIGIHKKQQLAELLSSGSICEASIMIGDRAVDIEAARANGLGAIGVLWGHGSIEELQTAGPNKLLKSPNQLNELRYVV
ncbi:MAG TPA: HAD hydrolase-like protein [Novimethylophilus sp.]|jgi:phosphoglycolate phosphatase|uniref:HAD hydrolase-like protein n=1 Tax=Novimethylophilus sp. TaxID=2137426 RepID=UPI002F41F71E